MSQNFAHALNAERVSVSSIDDILDLMARLESIQNPVRYSSVHVFSSLDCFGLEEALDSIGRPDSKVSTASVTAPALPCD